MRSKLVQGRKSINCANSVLPAYILNPREMVPENLADTRFCVQVDTTPKAEIPSSTQQVARYNRVLNRTAVNMFVYLVAHSSGAGMRELGAAGTRKMTRKGKHESGAEVAVFLRRSRVIGPAVLRARRTYSRVQRCAAVVRPAAGLHRQAA